MARMDSFVDLSRATWRKSARSSGNGGACVEIATNLPGVVAVRDSKDPDGPKLIINRQSWERFTKTVQRDG